MRNRDHDNGSSDMLHTVHTEEEYNAMLKSREYCGFYLKTGVCRYGNGCSINHLTLPQTPTILIQNFFYHEYLEEVAQSQPELKDKNNSNNNNDNNNNNNNNNNNMVVVGNNIIVSGGSSNEEKKMLAAYDQFYHNIMQKFSAAGTIVWFKCCCNLSAHLRGNVYIQYADSESAKEAVAMFNGFYYEERRLEVELTPVTHWVLATCGFFKNEDPTACPHGDYCNYLHTLINPGNEFPGRKGSPAHHPGYPRTYRFIERVEILQQESRERGRSRTISERRMDQRKSYSRAGRSRSPSAARNNRNDNYDSYDDDNNQEVSQRSCDFYLKTHACRFERNCRLQHTRPKRSPTIIVRNLFNHRLLHGEELYPDEQRQLQFDYRRFYEEVIVKFRCVGPVVMVKCARNRSDHLRGNFYVQYSDPRYAEEAVGLLNGHVYEGIKMEVELCNVKNWSAALCTSFHDDSCQRRDFCNFIHDFRNPRDEYSGAFPSSLDSAPPPRQDGYPQHSERKKYRTSRSPSRSKGSTNKRVRKEPDDRTTVPEDKKKDSKKESESSASHNRTKAEEREDSKEKEKPKPKHRNRSSAPTHDDKRTSQRHRSPLATEERGRRERSDRGRSPVKKHRPVEDCPAIFKRGICPWGDKCFKSHRAVDNSSTMMVLNYFKPSDWGGEASAQEKFEQFYDEVIEKFQSFGEVVMFQCSRNEEAIYNGTVYVQYTSREDAVEAVEKMEGFSYMGRQLEAQLCAITNWNHAICSKHYHNGECPQPRCPGLHVFHNPGGVFPRPPTSGFQPLDREFRKEEAPFGSCAPRDDATMWL